MENKNIINVVKVRFPYSTKLYLYDCENNKLNVGDKVLVKSNDGFKEVNVLVGTKTISKDELDSKGYHLRKIERVL